MRQLTAYCTFSITQWNFNIEEALAKLVAPAIGLFSLLLPSRFNQARATSQFLKRIFQAGGGAVIKHAGVAIDAKRLHRSLAIQ